MKRTIFILFLFLFLFIPRTKSQIVQESHPAYKHFYHAVIDNDTVLVIELRTFHVFPPEKFKDKKQEKFYWKTVRDVKKTLPYAKLIYSILIETYEYMETLPDDKAREEHMKKMEKEVFQQYKPVLKKLRDDTDQYFAQWQYAPKLREELVLLLDENLCAELNKHHLHYDRKTGLSSRKEDKEK